MNSLHGQGILEPGERIVVEGVAEDGTIEAIRIADAPGFALGVQWHAEYDPQGNAVNRALFQAFGEALVARKGSVSSAAAGRCSAAAESHSLRTWPENRLETRHSADTEPDIEPEDVRHRWRNML